MTYTVVGSGQLNSHNMLHLCTQHNLAIIYLQCLGATLKNIHILQHIQTNCSIEFGSDNFPTIYIYNIYRIIAQSKWLVSSLQSHLLRVSSLLNPNVSA